jgi:hypothetical protein
MRTEEGSQGAALNQSNSRASNFFWPNSPSFEIPEIPRQAQNPAAIVVPCSAFLGMTAFDGGLSHTLSLSLSLALAYFGVRQYSQQASPPKIIFGNQAAHTGEKFPLIEKVTENLSITTKTEAVTNPIAR